MSKLCITLVLVSLALVFVSGCTTGETYAERSFRITQSWDIDSRLMMDDIDDILLIDKNSTLSFWHQRTGF
jgi:hypothetical protein